MRTLKQLYTLLHKHSNKSRMKVSGICHEITQLMVGDIITNHERYKLKHHLETQRPTHTLYPEFFNERRRGNPYWWDCKESVLKTHKDSSLSRTRFIKHIIKTL